MPTPHARQRQEGETKQPTSKKWVDKMKEAEGKCKILLINF